MTLPTFVINLTEEKNKRRHVEEVLKNSELDLNFVEAIYGKHLSKVEVEKVYDDKKCRDFFGRSLTPGEIGCALSHIEAYNQIVNRELDFALIIEDDVNINIPATNISRILTKLPKEFNVILLGHHPGYARNKDTTPSLWNRLKLGRHHRLNSFSEIPVGGYAYLITSDYAKRRIIEFSKIYKPIDHWQDPGIKSIKGINPTLFSIHQDYSDNSNLDQERKSVMFERTDLQKKKDIIRHIMIKMGVLNIILSIKARLRGLLPWYM